MSGEVDAAKLLQWQRGELRTRGAEQRLTLCAVRGGHRGRLRFGVGQRQLGVAGELRHAHREHASLRLAGRRHEEAAQARHVAHREAIAREAVRLPGRAA